jgi:hypothetical protein
MLSALLVLFVQAAPVAAPMDVAPAFRRAYGFEPASRFVAPPGDGPKAKLTLTSRLLAPLGGDWFALVISEDDLGASYHAERGAVSIAYLQRHGGRWRLIQRWDEFAWTGDTGSAADEMRIQRFTGQAPLLFATKSYMGNGQQTRTAWTIRLTPRGPELLGDAPIGGSVEPVGRDAAEGWNYSGRIGPPRTRNAAFSVTYRGWISQGGPAVRKPISSTVDYTARAGALAGPPKLFLP